MKPGIKKLILKIHLWVGLSTGIIVAVVGLTGSLYVFQPEITGWLSKEYLTTKGEISNYTDKEIARKIENTTRGKIESLQWPMFGRQTYMFKLFDDEAWYYFDQTTGAVSSASDTFLDSFFNLIVDIHTSLTLGEVGYVITATASLLLAVVLISSGIYLWWPHNKNRRRSSFTIRWNASKKRLNYDLHNVSGFYFTIPLILMAITGAFFHYDEELQWVIDKITFSKPAPSNAWTDNLKSNPAGNARPLSIFQTLEVMDQHYPEFYKRNLWLTGDSLGYYTISYHKNKETHAGPDHRIFMMIDQYSGNILADTNPANLPLGARITNQWLLPVHFGDFGGMFTRVLWCIGGLLPTLLLITGFLIWGGRRKKKSLQPKQAPSAIAGSSFAINKRTRNSYYRRRKKYQKH